MATLMRSGGHNEHSPAAAVPPDAGPARGSRHPRSAAAPANPGRAPAPTPAPGVAGAGHRPALRRHQAMLPAQHAEESFQRVVADPCAPDSSGGVQVLQPRVVRNTDDVRDSGDVLRRAGGRGWLASLGSACMASSSGLLAASVPRLTSAGSSGVTATPHWQICGKILAENEMLVDFRRVCGVCALRTG